MHGAHHVALFGQQRGAFQQLGHAQDAVQRRAQLMRHVRQEIRFRPVGQVGLLAGVAGLVQLPFRRDRFLRQHHRLRRFLDGRRAQGRVLLDLLVELFLELAFHLGHVAGQQHGFQHLLAGLHAQHRVLPDLLVELLLDMRAIGFEDDRDHRRPVGMRALTHWRRASGRTRVRAVLVPVEECIARHRAAGEVALDHVAIQPAQISRSAWVSTPSATMLKPSFLASATTVCRKTPASSSSPAPLTKMRSILSFRERDPVQLLQRGMAGAEIVDGKMDALEAQAQHRLQAQREILAQARFRSFPASGRRG